MITLRIGGYLLNFTTKCVRAAGERPVNSATVVMAGQKPTGKLKLSQTAFSSHHPTDTKAVNIWTPLWQTSAQVGHQEHQSGSNQFVAIQLATVSSFSIRIQVKIFLSFSTMPPLDNYTANKCKKSKETVRSDCCFLLRPAYLHSLSFLKTKARECNALHLKSKLCFGATEWQFSDSNKAHNFLLSLLKSNRSGVSAGLLGG